MTYLSFLPAAFLKNVGSPFTNISLFHLFADNCDRGSGRGPGPGGGGAAMHAQPAMAGETV